MSNPVSDATLEQFRSAAAGTHPTPAGVAVAAVSAGFALGLIAKALAVSARRKAVSENTARLEPLVAAAQTASERMLQLAAEDSAAFESYLTAARLPKSTEAEGQRRRQTVDAAARRSTELPLVAAREAATGLQLCREASTLTHIAVIADLGAAASLLSGALRVFLLCAESNVRQLAPDDDGYAERVSQERDQHEHAFHQADEVLELVAATLEAAAGHRREP